MSCITSTSASLILGLAALTLSACATAPASTTPTVAPKPVATQSATMTSEDAATEASLDEEVCKKQPVTGSRFGKRICLTRREWRDRQEAAKRTTDSVQNPGGLYEGSGGG